MGEAQRIEFSESVVALMIAMLRSGSDTVAIAKRFGVEEVHVYNAMARRRGEVAQ